VEDRTEEGQNEFQFETVPSFDGIDGLRRELVERADEK